MKRGRERRLYETYVNSRTTTTGWQHFEQLFHPTSRTAGVEYIRIMLYAYHPPGVYAYDNLSITPATNEEHEKQAEQDRRDLEEYRRERLQKKATQKSQYKEDEG